MKLSEIIKNKRIIYSFEMFPPKVTSDISLLYRTLDELSDLNPDYISVTFGAGGSINNNRTVELASIIRNKYHIEALAHLTSVGNNKEDILRYLEQYRENGIDNILALRGDMRDDIPMSKDFKYASDLVSFIKDNGDFHISGGCYPEGHAECPSEIQDILNLKKKVDAGVEHLNSQLFFDNNVFYDFIDRTKMAGINVPVQAGIMPMVRPSQIQRIIMLSGTQIPTKLAKIIAKYSSNEESFYKAGLEYAITQIVDLIDNGVDGIHLYIMNNAKLAHDISREVYPIIDAVNKA